MILLANGRLITRDPDGIGYLADGGVVTEGSKIVEVGATADLKAKYPEAEFVDAKGGVIMPGLINAHTHLATTALRAFLDDLSRAEALEKQLSNTQPTHIKKANKDKPTIICHNYVIRRIIIVHLFANIALF